jgi:hypothetical protein
VHHGCSVSGVVGGYYGPCVVETSGFQMRESIYVRKEDSGGTWYNFENKKMNKFVIFGE